MSLDTRQNSISEQHDNLIQRVERVSNEKIANNFATLAAMREILELEIIKKCRLLGIDDADIKITLDKVAEKARFCVEMKNRFKKSNAVTK